ncbi:hypothetical protein pipiens_017287 [Culex pipiens pipiens]|uniref:Uncharacterized protein n=1 Tax=Culex pipiens pipiens TaxID=38569 RepID=A0ABD1CHA7_CULPP
MPRSSPATTYCATARVPAYVSKNTKKVTWTDLLATIPAIRNLKTKLYDTIDRNDPVQLNEFRKLLSLLFKSNASAAGGKTAAARSLCQPMENISDFLIIVLLTTLSTCTADVEETTGDYKYLGMFLYHISTKTWNHILIDCCHPSAAIPHVQLMLFHHKRC